jgi:hypothetical protein
VPALRNRIEELEQMLRSIEERDHKDDKKGPE